MGVWERWGKEFEAVSKQIFIFNILCNHTWILNFSYFFLSLCHHCLPLRDGNGFFFIMNISEFGANLSVHLENLLFQKTIMESRLLKNSTISPVRSFCSFLKIQKAQLMIFHPYYFAFLRCHLSPVSRWQAWLILMLLQLLGICVEMQIQILHFKKIFFSLSMCTQFRHYCNSCLVKKKQGRLRYLRDTHEYLNYTSTKWGFRWFFLIVMSQWQSVARKVYKNIYITNVKQSH